MSDKKRQNQIRRILSFTFLTPKKAKQQIMAGLLALCFILLKGLPGFFPVAGFVRPHLQLRGQLQIFPGFPIQTIVVTMTRDTTYSIFKPNLFAYIDVSIGSSN
jgi:hypothetical protein